MSEIKVNIEVLETKIQKLRDLKGVCEGIDVGEKDIEGSGESIHMLAFVDKEYTDLKVAYQTLIGNSISFFENIKKSVIEADEKAATKLK